MGGWGLFTHFAVVYLWCARGLSYTQILSEKHPYDMDLRTISPIIPSVGAKIAVQKQGNQWIFGQRLSFVGTIGINMRQ